MVDITINGTSNIRNVIQGAASGDRILFPDGAWNAGAAQVLIEGKKLTLEAVNVGGASLAGNFALGNAWEVRFNGLDLVAQDNTYLIDARQSQLFLTDTRLTAPANGTPIRALYAQGTGVYISATTRSLIHDWSGSQNVNMLDILYGAQIWAACSAGKSQWFRSPATGSGTMISLTMSPNNYFHNVRFGALSPTSRGNGITCMIMQRGSFARFEQDETAGSSTGFQNGGNALSLSGGSRALLEGFGTSFGRYYVVNFDVGISRKGPASRRDVDMCNVFFSGNRVRDYVNNSAGWWSF
jgi:hypothetical protein